MDYAPWIDSAFFMEFELSGVDMREIKDVVDDLEQVLAALVNEPESTMARKDRSWSVSSMGLIRNFDRLLYKHSLDRSMGLTCQTLATSSGRRRSTDT